MAGGEGLADTWVQPVTLGWSLKRADVKVGYAFMAPTGRFSPGASDNIGSGYWGNHFLTGTTVYLTKNKGTTANLFTDWEFHGSKNIATGTKVTPGQAFTTEWGLGQVLPLKKDFSRLLQLGVIGYDQWQVSDNRRLHHTKRTGKCGALLLRSRDWIPGKLPASCEGAEFLFQV